MGRIAAKKGEKRFVILNNHGKRCYHRHWTRGGAIKCAREMANKHNIIVYVATFPGKTILETVRPDGLIDDYITLG